MAFDAAKKNGRFGRIQCREVKRVASEVKRWAARQKRRMVIDNYLTIQIHVAKQYFLKIFEK